MTTPARIRVLVGKLAVAATTVLAAGVLATACSLLAGRMILPSNGFTPEHGYPLLSPADGPTLRAAAGTVLYLGLVAIFSAAVGAIIRDTAAATTVALATFYVVPIIAQFVSDPRWQERLQRFSPSSAGLAIQATTDLDRLPVGPWAGLGVLAGYAAVAVAIAAALFTTRDTR